MIDLSKIKYRVVVMDEKALSITSGILYRISAGKKMRMSFRFDPHSRQKMIKHRKGTCQASSNQGA